jgi:ligand-binding sensor domain-containing protein
VNAPGGVGLSFRTRHSSVGELLEVGDRGEGLRHYIAAAAEVLSSILMTAPPHLETAIVIRRAQIAGHTTDIAVARFRGLIRSPLSVLRLVSWIFCFLGLASAGFSAATNPDALPVAPAEYTMRAWHVADGLPSDEIGSLMQDENGYLWVATTAGLVRFDGTTFEPVGTPPEVSSRGMIYHRDPQSPGRSGLLTTGNINGNTDGNTPGNPDGYYARSDGAFRFQREAAAGDKTVRAVFTEENGTLWLGCEDGTIFRRSGETTEKFDAPSGLVGRKIPIFATDGEKHVWVSINTFVARFDGQRWVPLPEPHNGNEVRLASSKSGGPWILTTTAALKWSGERLEEITKLPELLGAHFVQAAIEDRYGKLWIGTRSQGLFRLSPQQVLPVATSHEDIYSLCEDSEGAVWVGTNGGGLNRLKPKIFQLFDKDSGLKDNFSSTVTEDAAGVIWLANRDGGVARIVDGKVDPVSRRAGWRQFSAMSVFPAAQGGVWVTSGIGVWRTYPGDSDRLERIRSLNDLKLVRSTLVARNGDYWLSLDPDRLARWRNNQVVLFGEADGFDGREVRGIAEDAAGVIWVGAGDGKLFRSRGDRFERVPLAGADGCGSLQVLRFTADGSLLIGTTLGGVIILPPSTTRTRGRAGPAPSKRDSNPGRRFRPLLVRVAWRDFPDQRRAIRGIRRGKNRSRSRHPARERRRPFGSFLSRAFPALCVEGARRRAVVCDAPRYVARRAGTHPERERSATRDARRAQMRRPRAASRSAC